MVGSFALVLHSHLPYYRKAGMWPFGEENLYEAMVGTYIPLLLAFQRLVKEGVSPRVTVGITPILAEQLADAYSQAGFERYVRRRLDDSAKDAQRFADIGQREKEGLARWYQAYFSETLSQFQRLNKDILGAFRRLADEGHIELITSCATHCFSPLVYERALQAQLAEGVQTYRRHFGMDPKGMWLPECAYRPGLGKPIHEAGIGFFFCESYAIEGGQPTERAWGPYGELLHAGPVFQPQGTTFEPYWLDEAPVAVLGRHQRISYQVWSADNGYPGDGLYREFHKKDDVSGNLYWRLTSSTTDLADKQLYKPDVAFNQVKQHARHFVDLIESQLAGYNQETGRHGVAMVPFDTELFGHWWFEGVAFLEEVLRRLATGDKVKAATVSGLLAEHPPERAIKLPASTWGAGGDYHVWNNDEVAWMWPEIHRREAVMERLSDQGAADAHEERVLKQAARELMLLEASDWPFLVTTGQARDYAKERFEGHCARFDELTQDPKSVSVLRLEELEELDNPFPDIDPALYRLPVASSR